MKIVLLCITLVLLFSTPIGASTYTITEDGGIVVGEDKILPLLTRGRLTGQAGVDLVKKENGNWLETLYIEGEYEIDKKFYIDFRFSENFSVLRGRKFPSIGNHHSWNYRLGLHYAPFTNGLTLYTAWDNSAMIDGHDNCFWEYDGNSNVFGLYYRW